MRSILIAAIVAMLAGSVQAGLIISEVVDGPLTGGTPKFVEITNTGAADYTFPDGGLIIQANDSADLDVDVNLAGVTIAAGQSYVLASTASLANFEATYGFAADIYNTNGFGNGDDRFLITDGTNVLDIYGVFGSRAAADLATFNYLDSYAYRLPDYVDGTGQTYDASQWFVPGADALEVGGSGEYTANLLALTTPGTHNFVPEPATMAFVLLGGLFLVRRR